MWYFYPKQLLWSKCNDNEPAEIHGDGGEKKASGAGSYCIASEEKLGINKKILNV